MSFGFHKVICSGASRFPAAVPELGRSASLALHNSSILDFVGFQAWFKG
jgi:hypothetical protein